MDTLLTEVHLSLGDSEATMTHLGKALAKIEISKYSTILCFTIDQAN